jgi:hypothetical protein
MLPIFVAALSRYLATLTRGIMAVTKQELIGSLQNEVRILLHLASKLDAKSLDYRPSAKQRSSLELLRYLSIMGPQLVQAAKTGTFDMDGWTAASAAAEARNLEQTLDVIRAQSGGYAEALGPLSDADFRKEIEMFGNKTTTGAFIMNLVVSGSAAYRTQLFLYLKACGREELNTMNLWAGIDPPAPAAAGA